MATEHKDMRRQRLAASWNPVRLAAAAANVTSVCGDFKERDHLRRYIRNYVVMVILGGGGGEALSSEWETVTIRSCFFCVFFFPGRVETGWGAYGLMEKPFLHKTI